MASAISFQGLSTNLPTDKLVDAIISQESQPMERMKAKQSRNATKSAALATLRTDLTSLSTALASMSSSGFAGRTVTSSDSTNSYVTATSNGGAPGVYDITVANVATRARLQLPPGTSLMAAAPVGTGTYTLTDMDGKSLNIDITSANNSLTGLRDAINNAKDANGKALNVNATIVQVGTDGKSQLVLSANDTGVGASGASSFSITGPAGNALGLTSSPTSSSTAVNAHFNINGVDLERASNTVNDAADGVSFTLKAPSAGKTTSLTVGLDKTAITTAMQSVVTKYNTLYNDYKTRTTSTKDSDGNTTSGVFANDSAIRGMVQQVHDALMGANDNLPASANFRSASAVGLKTNRDGTLSLDTTAFQAALDKDVNGVTNIFSSTGSSTSPLLSFAGANSATTSSPITFNIGSAVNGVTSGTFTTTPAGGSPFTATLTSSNGYFYGAAGTPFEGLAVKASDGAQGTLVVSKGVSQTLQDLIRTMTGSSAGSIGDILQNITTQNNNLSTQIASQQSRLDRRKATLQQMYANLESTVGQLNSAGQSIASM